MKRYGPCCTSCPSGRTSGTTLKFPIRTLKTAQNPNAQRGQLQPRKSGFRARIGPVMAIKSRQANWIATSA